MQSNNLDTFDQACKAALFDLYKKHPNGGLIRIGRGSIELMVTITSPITVQVTARHFNEIGKYCKLQWMNIRNGKINDYQERIK